MNNSMDSHGDVPAKFEDVLKIAMFDPFIYFSLQKYYRGEVTLETALLSCIVAMHSRYETQKPIENYLENSTRPLDKNMFLKGDEQR